MRTQLSMFASTSLLALTACPGPEPCDGQMVEFDGTMSTAEVATLEGVFDLEPGDIPPICDICNYIAENIYGESTASAEDCDVTIDWDAEEVVGTYACRVQFDHCDPLGANGQPIPTADSTLVETACGAYDSAKGIDQYGGTLRVYNYNASWDSYSFATDDGGFDIFGDVPYATAAGGNVFRPGEQQLSAKDPDGAVVGQTCLDMPTKLGHTVAVALPDGTFHSEFLPACADPADFGSDNEWYDPNCVDTLTAPVPVGGARLRVIDGTGEAHRYLRFSASADDREVWLTPEDFSSGVYQADFADVSTDMLGQDYTCICLDDDDDGLCDDDEIWPVPELAGAADLYEQYWAMLFVTRGGPGQDATLRTRLFYPKVTGGTSPSVVIREAIAPDDISSGAWDACEEANTAHKRLLDPLACYTFEGDANDSSRNGRNGSLMGGTAFVPGRTGQAVELDGTNGYVSLPPLSSEDFSISGWIFYAAAPGTWSRFFEHSRDMSYPSTGTLFVTLNDGSKSMHARIWADGSPVSQTDSVPTPTAGEWHHIVATYDQSGAGLALYVDGALAGTAPYDGQGFDDWGTQIFNLGRSSWPGDPDPYVAASYDEVFVYDYAISADAVSALYRQDITCADLD